MGSGPREKVLVMAFSPTVLRPLRLLSLVLLMLFLVGCREGGTQSTGELAGLRVSKSEGVRGASRLNDGLVPKEGGSWNSNRTAVFSSSAAYVEYDLGSEKSISAVALMGDNNDTYLVSGSTDGYTFKPLFTAQRVRETGMRWRHESSLNASARYLRLQPGRGDASLSVAELNIFVEPPPSLPPRLSTVSAVDVALQLRSALLILATLLIVASVFAVQGGSSWLNTGLLAAVVGGLGYVGWAAVEAYPIQKLEVSLARGIAAGVALVVVLRTAFSPDKFPPLKWLQVSLLGILACVSIFAFYNLGTPQFFDHKNRQPSVVHNFDMRVYFPVAKYFSELKYDGLYLASVASYAEEHGGLEAPHIQRVELRDLRNHRMRKVSDIQGEVEGVRRRFSDERWKSFKEDMRYFWETMGSSGYLGSMADHGGNATPVWLSVAYLMFKSAPASNEILLLTGLLDPLLLLIFAVAVFRTFGPSTAFVSLIVFGANDFYMFGSNWAGATLRNDWMVYLGLGACAFQAKRFRLAGGLLALSALIRAFPAMTLLALGVPVAHYLFEERRRSGELPSLQQFLKKQRWFVDAALGASICLGVCVLGSSLILGMDAWPLWVKKISSFTDSPHVNHISLLTVIAGSEGRQAEVLQQRAFVYYAAIALYFALAIWIGARAKPHRVALLGAMMMPVTMYPANYYMHFIFLLPLLVSDPGRLSKRFPREAAGKVWAILLLICAAQYFTVRETDLAVHFYNASVILMAGLLAVLVALLPRDPEGRIDFDSVPFVPSKT
jgi:hypothetical protein